MSVCRHVIATPVAITSQVKNVSTVAGSPHNSTIKLSNIQTIKLSNNHPSLVSSLLSSAHLTRQPADMSSNIKKLALAVALPLAAQNALATSKRPKIAGGAPVPSGVNYVVEIDIGSFTKCTGTLLSPEHLLTTASCFLDDFGVRRDDFDSLTITNQITGASLSLESMELFVPDTFGPESQPSYKEFYAGNIAVVRIPSLSDLGEVTYPSLPESADRLTEAPEVFVVGAGEDLTSMLDTRYGSFEVASGLGETPPGEYIEIESDHFTVTSDSSSLCYGDNAAPLVAPGSAWTEGNGPTEESSQDVVLGVSSWTTAMTCLDPGVYAFVDVFTHKDFIMDVISGSIEPMELLVI